MRLIRIFLSSPGDCASERNAVHVLASTLNADPMVNNFARIEVIAWDWQGGIAMEAHQSPQTSVDERLPTPETCEIFVGIFRNRFGTPLPMNECLYRKLDGTGFGSGSEYEFHRAWAARRRGASLPHVLMYRLQPQAITEPDTEQLDRLETFLSGDPFSEDGSNGFVHQFQHTTDFSEQLHRHLRQLISQWHPQTRLSLPEWLKQQAKRLTLDAGPRYTVNAHVESEISKVFDWLLARPSAIRQFDDALAKVWKHLPNDSAFEPYRTQLAAAAGQLQECPHWEALPDFKSIRDLLIQLNELAWEQLRPAYQSAQEQMQSGQSDYQQYELRKLSSETQSASELIDTFASYARSRVLLLTGSAGQGKTHTLIHELNKELIEGRIAVGVLGHTLSANGDLWSAILQRLESTTSQSAFLDELENAAATNHQRALIVIDALNETHDRARWKGQLSSMLDDILSRPHLTVALGLRSDYRDLVLPRLASEHEKTWVEYQHPGFRGVAADALAAYCSHYGVTVPVVPPVGELSNPLYVQLLVKSLRGRAHPVHWLPSWLDVWQGWIERLEQDTVGKLNLDDQTRRNPIRRTLNRLADAMIRSGDFRLSRLDADRVAEETTGDKKVVAYLCSAGALLDQVGDEDEDLILFGYERLCDTFIIDRLFAKLPNSREDKQARHQELASAMALDGALYPLANPMPMEHPLSQNRAGLLRALCLMAPREAGVEVPELLALEYDSPRGWKMQDWDLQNAFLDSLRWRHQPEDFAYDADKLLETFRALSVFNSSSDSFDELIRLALIPGHPFAAERLLHPWLCGMQSPGARDGEWTIHIVPLWLDENSNLNVLLRWSGESDLIGLHESVALPAAQVLAWVTSTSQQGQREAAVRGLTRVLAACPNVLSEFLPDFLAVNDGYVLEGVLIATLGVLMKSDTDTACAIAARLVYESLFSEGNAKWCHLTIRHYARCIVEQAHKKGWLPNVDLAIVTPPYRSSLPLNELPSENELRDAGNASGYRSIISSCFGRDFYWYVMGATSGPKPFLAKPLPGSVEPPRHSQGEVNGLDRSTAMFDVNLAARFVVWSCSQLGWTSERFDAFDTGHYAAEHSRIAEEGRNERIGKKYQWLGWQTMLAFLADNYEMRPSWGDEPQKYDNPNQISYINVIDPSRWLFTTSRLKRQQKCSKDFRNLGRKPIWPKPTLAAIRQWVEAPANDLSPIDLIHHTPELPLCWGNGNWIQLTIESSWEDNGPPGQWGEGQCFKADIWWQIIPFLIESKNVPTLLSKLGNPVVQDRLSGIGRIDVPTSANCSLLEWKNLLEEFDSGFERKHDFSFDVELPVPWMPMVASSGVEDRTDAHRSVLMPWPRLIREWGLTVDLERGCVLHGDEVVFGLAGLNLDNDVIFANCKPLQRLLMQSGYTLLWVMRGERRAFLDWGSFSHGQSAWVDYYAVGTLGGDSSAHLLCINRELR